MTDDLRAERAALVIEVDRARQWRRSAALDRIRNSLEARLEALDKVIKQQAAQPR